MPKPDEKQNDRVECVECEELKNNLFKYMGVKTVICGKCEKEYTWDDIKSTAGLDAVREIYKELKKEIKEFVKLWRAVHSLPNPHSQELYSLESALQDLENRVLRIFKNVIEKTPDIDAVNEPNDIILELWNQYAHEAKVAGVDVMNDGGMSSLSRAESYLRKHKLIDSHGFPCWPEVEGK